MMKRLTEELALGRILIDFAGYSVFLFSAYIMFGTSLDFRYLLFPITFFAFFATISKRHRDAFDDGFSTAEYLLSDEYEDEDEDVAEVAEDTP